MTTDFKHPRWNGTAGAESQDRLPPHDQEAERATLGCIMLDWQTVMPICIQIIGSKTDFFYDLRHQEIYRCMVEMYDVQEAIDLITLKTWLEFQSLLESIGGLTYLAALTDSVPSAANITFYLDILKDKVGARRLIQLCTSQVAKVYDKGGPSEELIGQAANEILGLAEDSSPKDEESPIQELITTALDQIETWHSAQGVLTGVATGFVDLDKMTTGFQPGEMIVLAGRPSMGKAQPLDAKVLTQFGFVEIGTLATGDRVIGWDGLPKEVLGVFPQGVMAIFEIEMSDGTKTRATGSHLWFTQTRNERRRGCHGSVKTTDQILSTIHRGDGGKCNHVLPLCRPVEFSGPIAGPLDPWLLGALLGDGKLRDGNVMFSKPEQDVQLKVAAKLPETDCIEFNGMDGRIKRKVKTNEPSATRSAILFLGLNQHSAHKFIPREYMFAPHYQRLELLRGLLDTDGFVNGTSVEFSSSSLQLAEDVAWLVRSLGGICCFGEERFPSYSYKGEKKIGQVSHRMQIWFLDNTIPVSSQKQLSKWRSGTRHVHRSISKITEIGLGECVCIMLDDPDGLYITDDFIVTHNTSLAMNIAEHAAVDQGLPVGIFSLEMTKLSLVVRMVCSRARVNVRNIQHGFLSNSDFPKLTSAAGRLNTAQIFINDQSGLSIIGLRTRARRMHQQHGIRLLVIDYLQLMNAERNRNDSREQEVSAISKGVKGLAKELGIPVIAISQLNRGIEKDKERRPRMSDLRESGSLEQDADFVGILWKPTRDTDEDEGDALPVNLEICKQRNGPTGTVPLVFLRQFTRFESVARTTSELGNQGPSYNHPYADNEPPEPDPAHEQQPEMPL